MRSRESYRGNGGVENSSNLRDGNGTPLKGRIVFESEVPQLGGDFSAERDGGTLPGGGAAGDRTPDPGQGSTVNNDTASAAQGISIRNMNIGQRNSGSAGDGKEGGIAGGRHSLADGGVLEGSLGISSRDEEETIGHVGERGANDCEVGAFGDLEGGGKRGGGINEGGVGDVDLGLARGKEQGRS